MRYYLTVEQTLGIRLPANGEPCPGFSAAAHTPEEGHVVFISATSMPHRKNYGTAGFAALAADLQSRWPRRRWRFTLLTGEDHNDQDHAPILQPAGRLDAAACVDLFAAAEVVVGNDTGLTHLAALTRRPDGSRPTVLGIYGRHGYAKWTTGSPDHHAIATPFSHLMSIADACPVRDGYDDTVWGTASDLGAIPATLIADALGQITGWKS
jgi:ADP-heptose:LPS heptosyltransferase